jgi:hypothetical protein
MAAATLLISDPPNGFAVQSEHSPNVGSSHVILYDTSLWRILFRNSGKY